jgi:polyisoprenoid-binding protein YceI
VIFAAFVVGAGVGILIYTYTVGGSGEPSATISAPTLNPFDGQALATENAALRAQVETLSTSAAALVLSMTEESLAVDVTSEPTDEPVVEATPVPTDEPTVEVAALVVPVTFGIVAGESQVSFMLEEDLRGTRTTVIGTTNQVAGQIVVDFANPAASRMGAIRINIRTLATDNEFRNRAIRSEILQSAQAQYEFSDFIPKSLSGLPERVAVGDTFTFQVTGDFPLAGVTREVTFDVTLTVVSETRIEGIGTTTVLRSDYGLQIPPVPSVANVTDEVALEIQFVAVAQ